MPRAGQRKTNGYYPSEKPRVIVVPPKMRPHCMKCQEPFLSVNDARLCDDCNFSNLGASRREGMAGGGKYQKQSTIGKE